MSSPSEQRPAPPSGQDPPVVIFGAFDRHNLGDLLLAHVADALLPGRVHAFAGLATRDLRPHGGHAVQALPELAAAWPHGPAVLWHAGGELLTCRAWQAALMLMADPAEAAAAAPYLMRRPGARTAWARRTLGTEARAPYVVSRARFPEATRVVFGGVGGVALARAPQLLQQEVRDALAAADAPGVRDPVTHAWLQAAGIRSRLMPDPALAVADLFGERIARHAAQGEVALLRARFPQGWIALQCSAVFGDDATLDTLAAALTRASQASGAAIVLWRAGAAPWHDDLDVLQRLASRLGHRRWHVLQSLNVWDLCALIANARVCAASSLHARLVAAAFARPRVTLAPPVRGESARKHRAVIAAWDAGVMPGVVTVGWAERALMQAQSVLAGEDVAVRDRARAATVAQRCKAEITALWQQASG